MGSGATGERGTLAVVGEAPTGAGVEVGEPAELVVPGAGAPSLGVRVVSSEVNASSTARASAWASSVGATGGGGTGAPVGDSFCGNGTVGVVGTVTEVLTEVVADEALGASAAIALRNSAVEAGVCGDFFCGSVTV